MFENSSHRNSNMVSDEGNILDEGERIHPILMNFNPPDMEWQIVTCSRLNLHFISAITYNMGRLTFDSSVRPDRTWNIATRGDGSCFFRSISVIVSGTEDAKQSKVPVIHTTGIMSVMMEDLILTFQKWKKLQHGLQPTRCLLYLHY